MRKKLKMKKKKEIYKSTQTKYTYTRHTTKKAIHFLWIQFDIKMFGLSWFLNYPKFNENGCAAAISKSVFTISQFVSI